MKISKQNKNLEDKNVDIRDSATDLDFPLCILLDSAIQSAASEYSSKNFGLLDMAVLFHYRSPIAI